jgi:hypothetical protein
MSACALDAAAGASQPGAAAKEKEEKERGQHRIAFVAHPIEGAVHNKGFRVKLLQLRFRLSPVPAHSAQRPRPAQLARSSPRAAQLAQR